MIRSASTVVVASVLALVLAGCGSSSSQPAASVASQQTLSADECAKINDGIAAFNQAVGGMDRAEAASAATTEAGTFTELAEAHAGSALSGTLSHNGDAWLSLSAILSRAGTSSEIIAAQDEIARASGTLDCRRYLP